MSQWLTFVLELLIDILNNTSKTLLIISQTFHVFNKLFLNDTIYMLKFFFYILLNPFNNTQNNQFLTIIIRGTQMDCQFHVASAFNRTGSSEISYGSGHEMDILTCYRHPLHYKNIFLQLILITSCHWRKHYVKHYPATLWSLSFCVNHQFQFHLIVIILLSLYMAAFNPQLINSFSNQDHLFFLLIVNKLPIGNSTITIKYIIKNNVCWSEIQVNSNISVSLSIWSCWLHPMPYINRLILQVVWIICQYLLNFIFHFKQINGLF